jgi:hypothetical protein
MLGRAVAALAAEIAGRCSDSFEPILGRRGGRPFSGHPLAAFRALMILSKSPQQRLRKGGTSVMRY